MSEPRPHERTIPDEPDPPAPATVADDRVLALPGQGLPGQTARAGVHPLLVVALVATAFGGGTGFGFALARRIEGLQPIAPPKVVTATPPAAPVATPGARAEEHLKRGLAQLEAKELDKALGSLTTAIELDPTLARAFHARGLVQEARNDREAALADFDRAIAADSLAAAPWIDRARVRAMGDPEGAHADLDRVLSRDPTNASAWATRAHVLLLQRDLGRALAAANKAIELDEKAAPAWRMRAAARLVARDLDGAIDDYTRAINLEPGDAPTWANRALAKKNKRDVDGALADVTHASELDPKHAPYHVERTVLLVEKGDLDAALLAAEAAIARDGRSAPARNVRAFAKLKKHDWKGVVADATAAIELDEKFPDAWLNRGIAREQLGDKAGASDLETFARLAPHHPQAEPARRLAAELRARK